MLCFRGFEPYSRWVPLATEDSLASKGHFLWVGLANRISQSHTVHHKQQLVTNILVAILYSLFCLDYVFEQNFSWLSGTCHVE